MPQVEAGFAALRGTYNETFRHFSLQVRLLQSLMSQPTMDGRAVEEAKRRVEQAHSAYRESRDLLAQFTLSRHVRSAALKEPQAETAKFGQEPQGSEADCGPRVEHLAYQLWEEAGRPSGKAEEHWYLAERLIHSAA